VVAGLEAEPQPPKASTASPAMTMAEQRLSVLNSKEASAAMLVELRQ
jgi:hypothetical protein